MFIYHRVYFSKEKKVVAIWTAIFKILEKQQQFAKTSFAFVGRVYCISY